MNSHMKLQILEEQRQENAPGSSADEAEVDTASGGVGKFKLWRPEDDRHVVAPPLRLYNNESHLNQFSMMLHSNPNAKMKFQAPFEFESTDQREVGTPRK